MDVLQIRIALLVLCLNTGAHAQNEQSTSSKPDTFLNSIELLEKYGYPAEEHSIITEDGYNLTVHRIPHGKNIEKATKPPVMLQHGMLASSAELIYTGPGHSLALLLADFGYDVWLGNARGNTYSEKHVNLSNSDQKFWEFSWHEIGIYDLPAVIDYIVDKTGVEKIFYVGHSMGTTVFYVMCSERPDYNDKIRAMFSMAPSAYCTHMASPVRYLAGIGELLQTAANIVGVYDVPSSPIFSFITSNLCNEIAITEVLCENILFLIGGYDSELLNKTLIPVIMGHTPAGTSLRTLVHYAQGVTSKRFRQYNFGALQNMDKYGSETPPDYDLSRVRAPVALHYGENDWQAAVVDVEQLNRELGNSIGMFKVPFPEFNHLDFLFAINATALVYEPILKQMENY